MEAIEIFKEVIGKRLLPLVVSFNPYTKKYQIHPFRHAITPTFEKDFSDILFDSIIFYAFEKNEIEREYDRGKLSDLRRASRAAYESRVPKTEKQVDGLLGELALDNFIKMFESSTQSEEFDNLLAKLLRYIDILKNNSVV